MLSAEDCALLAFEESYEMGGGMKEARMRETFGIPPSRYFQRLLRLARTEAALAEFPQLVHRIERRMADRARKRDDRLLSSGA